MPQNSSATARTTNSSPNRQSRTIETRGGSTVTVGAGRGTTTTPGGVEVGGAGRGVVVQGPQGQVYARGRGAVGATDGTNRAVAGGARTGVRTAGGETAVAGRGVRAGTDGQNTVVRGGAGVAAQDRYGNTRAAVRGGTVATDGTNVYRSAGAARAVRDPAGNVVAAGRAVQTYNGALVSQRQVAAVRSGFTGYTRYFTPGWYAQYPRAWVAAGIATAAWWSGAYWDSAAGYCDCGGEPVSYDYGDTITYEGDTVYSGEEPIATTEEYYEQAVEIAAAGEVVEENAEDDQTASDDDSGDWLPLGVFAIVSEGQETTDKVLQLAVNKSGIIRGNLHGKLADQVAQVTGSVDRETQRVAFRPAKKEKPIAECGLYNLTQNALTILVHFDKDRVEERKLIRLEQPADTQQQQ